MSYGLKSLEGILWGSIIGAIKEDRGSLDPKPPKVIRGILGV